MPLTPVFGVSASATFLAAPPPFVLPFPGVPMLTGSLGGSIGIPGLGGVAGGLTIGPGGVTGALSGGVGPVSGNIAIGPGGEISGGIGAGFALPGGLGNISGNIGLGPDGITGSLGGSASIGPFSLAFNASLPPLMTADKPGGLFRGPVWGIFDMNSKPIAPWETVTKVSYRHEMKVADFPIEDGGFASYNKVWTPYDARVTFVVGGGHGAGRRTELLAALERAVKSLEFFTVVTPEATYYRANLIHLEYNRESTRGVNLLVVEVWVQEVRPAETALTAESGDKDTKSPTSKAAGNNGQTQAISKQIGAPEEPPPVGAQDFAKPAQSQIGAPDAPPPVGAQDFATPPAMPTGSATAISQTVGAPTPPPPVVVSNLGSVGADPRFTTPNPTATY